MNVELVYSTDMIDTHCHLNKEFYTDLDEVIKKCNSHIIITSGTSDSSNNEVIELCNKYENVYGTIGIHPTELAELTTTSLEFIENNLNNSKIVGIGEIGLDYYWVKDNKDKQKEIFIKQIELAKKYNKAIVVHSRESINDTYEILEKYAKGLKIDLHCYSSSIEMARKFIELGAKLGIGGVITFKNSKKLQELVKEIDLEHFLLETDSPFLTPEPYRGKRNDPYNVRYIAEKIAEIKGIDVEEVIKITATTSISQFDLNINM